MDNQKLIIVVPEHGYNNGNLIYYSVHNDVYIAADVGDDYMFLKEIDTGNYVLVEPIPIYEGYVARNLGSATEITVGGLSLLAGADVIVVVDGENVGTKTVSAEGEISFANALGANIKVGLPFQSMVRTLRLDINTGSQTSQSNMKRIKSIVPRLVNSRCINIKAAEETVKVNVDFTNTSEDIETNIMSGYETRATVEFNSEEEKSLTILSCVISLEYKG